MNFYNLHNQNTNTHTVRLTSKGSLASNSSASPIPISTNEQQHQSNNNPHKPTITSNAHLQNLHHPPEFNPVLYWLGRIPFILPFVLPILIAVVLLSLLWIYIGLHLIWVTASAYACYFSYELYYSQNRLHTRQQHARKHFQSHRVQRPKSNQQHQQQQQFQTDGVSFFPISGTNQTHKVRVLTFNMFMRPPLIKNNKDDFKNERLAEFYNVIDQFDILCLQEIFSLGNSRQRQLIRHCEKQGFQYHVRSYNAPLNLAHKFIDGGVLILSRFPIVEHDCLVYSRGNQIDAFATKQVVYAKVCISSVDDCYLHVSTTHLQASYFDNPPDVNAVNDEVRLFQVQEMVEFIRKKCENTHYPFLVTGDFNVNARCDLDLSQRISQTTSEKALASKESSDYHQLKKMFVSWAGNRFHDLLFEHNEQTHPNTYGDVTDDGLPREVVLTHHADHSSQMCIDYLMWIDPSTTKPIHSKVSETSTITRTAHVLTAVNKDNKEKEKENGINGVGHYSTHDNQHKYIHVLQPVQGSTKVEPFFVDNKLVTQISDHYAIRSELQVVCNSIEN